MLRDRAASMGQVSSGDDKLMEKDWLYQKPEYEIYNTTQIQGRKNKKRGHTEEVQPFEQQLVKQIQETVKIPTPNSRMSSRVQKSMELQNMIKLQSREEQQKVAQKRQQAVLRRFYIKSKFDGSAMSSKLQKMMEYQPPIMADKGLNHKDAKQLELLAQLSDERKHDRLLEQALLKDFYLTDKKEASVRLIEDDIQNAKNSFAAKQKNQQFLQSRLELERWLTLHQGNQVRLNLRAIDQVSKTQQVKSFTCDQEKMKKSEERRKRMASITQRTNKYKIEIVRQFIQNDLLVKRRQNIDVIDYLTDFNPKNIAPQLASFIGNIIDIEQVSQNKKKVLQFDQKHLNWILRKIFFVYSKKDEADFNKIYQEMTQQKAIEFFKFVHITPNIVEYQVLQQIITKITKNKVGGHLSFPDFQSVVRKVGQLYYSSNSPSKFASHRRHDVFEAQNIEIPINPPSEQQSLSSLGQTGSLVETKNTMEHFYKDVLLQNEQKFLNPLEQDIINHQNVKEFLRRFQPVLKRLFNFSFQLKGVLTNSHIAFDDVFQLLWRINLFPRLIAKSTIRYFYYYMINHNEGLDQEYFYRFCNVIGLYIVRNTPFQRKKNEILSNIINYFKQMETINKSALIVMNDLGYFYTDPLFLDMEHLEDKLSVLL